MIFELVGQIATVIAAAAGLWWGFEKWLRRDEHFPRVSFEVSANFVGEQAGHVVTELVAVLENKGVVPLKIRNFTFKLRGLQRDEPCARGSEELRRQLVFPRLLDEGDFVPSSWEYSFVYPGVRTEYNFVTAIPADIAFIRMQADFDYLGERDASHHAAKILAVASHEAARPA